jgi:hypothetical protein
MPMTLKTLNMFATDLYAGLLSMFKGDAGRRLRALDAVTAERVSP